MINQIMEKWFGQSWRTTVGGGLAALQPLVTGAMYAAQYSQPKWLVLVLSLCSGLGLMILGGTAKDADVHSTAAQIETSTIAEAKQSAAIALLPKKP